MENSKSEAVGYSKYLKKLIKGNTQISSSGNSAVSEIPKVLPNDSVDKNHEAKDKQLISSNEPSLIKGENKQPDGKPGSFLNGEIDKDKLTLDIELAIINVLKDRQFKQRLLKNREEELINLQIEYEALKKDQENALLTISQKNKEIEQLKNWQSVQKLNYDQLAEDYQELQSQALRQEEEIKGQMERIQDKYQQMNLEYETYKNDHMKQYTIIKEKLLDKEIENKQLSDQNKKIMADKEALFKNIQEFTARMSGNLIPFQTSGKKEPSVIKMQKSSEDGENPPRQE